jgi:prepilin-type N-terminal cleavage/methylation domain-containing protein
MKTAYKHNRGFTLIEMMIVVGIMMIMIAAAATLMQPASESRRTREAGRAINVYLSSARNRAMQLGRPCGVTFHTFSSPGGPPFAMTTDQSEVPPCYAGETDTSAVSLSYSGGNTVTAIFSEGLVTGFARPGDEIQINGQGPHYTLDTTNSTDGDGYITATGTASVTLTLSNSRGQLVPWPRPGDTPSRSQPMPFRIFRSPMKSTAAPLQLPTGAVVDFSPDLSLAPWRSGTAYLVGSIVKYNKLVYYATRGKDPNTTPPPSADDINRGREPSSSSSYWKLADSTDTTILFSPNGSVDSVWTSQYGTGATRQIVTNTIYLLVGKRERMLNALNDYKAEPVAAEKKNFQDLNNVWVTVNPFTGAIATEPVAVSNSALENMALNQSRSLAAQGQGMGGK